MAKKKSKFPKSQYKKFIFTNKNQFRILDKDGKPKEDKPTKEKCADLLREVEGL